MRASKQRAKACTVRKRVSSKRLKRMLFELVVRYPIITAVKALGTFYDIMADAISLSNKEVTIAAAKGAMDYALLVLHHSKREPIKLPKEKRETMADVNVEDTVGLKNGLNM